MAHSIMYVNNKRWFALLSLLAWERQHEADAKVVITESVMKITETSAILSDNIYEPNRNVTGFDEYEVFVDEPDAAILAQKDGYCFLAFRGSTLSLSEWLDTLNDEFEDVCSEADGKKCCKAREGFFNEYIVPSYKSRLEFKVRTCYHQCKDKDECLVLTGHAEGGGIAAVAAILFEAYNPYVITFGDPPIVESNCKILEAERWYRFVNTATSDSEDTMSASLGFTYDPVPFLPGMGDMVYGKFIVLSDDPDDVAYVGLASTKNFEKLIGDDVANKMIGTRDKPGYLDRIETLKNETISYPTSLSGFRTHDMCTENVECASNKCEKNSLFGRKECVGDECQHNWECPTGRCSSGSCLPRFGSCMECVHNTDCASNRCIYFKCANLEGKMDDKCICQTDSECESERCDGYPFYGICETRLKGGEFCNEHSDCLSDRCNWFFHCTEERNILGELPEKARLLGNSMFSVPFLVGLGLLSVAFVSYDYIVRRRRSRYGYVSIEAQN